MVRVFSKISKPTERNGAYHSRNCFRLMRNWKLESFANGKEISAVPFRTFSVRNGTAEISLPFTKLSSFQSLISRKHLREIEGQMVSAILFGWFADFGKTFTIIQRSSQLVYSDKW